MVEAQDPLSPKPNRPFEPVSPYSTRHPRIDRPSHVPARFQSSCHPTAIPQSPSEMESPRTYRNTEPGTWRLSEQQVSPLQPNTPPETPIDSPAQRSEFAGSYFNLPSSRTYVNPSPPASDETYFDDLPSKPGLGRRFTYPSAYAFSSSSTHIASSPQTPPQQSHPDGSARSSPPLQHNGIPYTGLPPQSYNTNAVPPFRAAATPYPAPRGSTTSIHSSQARPQGRRPQTLASTPPSYYHYQQQVPQQQYSPVHQPSSYPTSPPIQTPGIPRRSSARQAPRVPQSAVPAAATAAASSRKPKPTSPDYRSSFPPVQTGVYRTYPIDVNAFSPPAPATPAAPAVRPPLSSSSSYSSRKQVRIKEDKPSFTSPSPSSSSDYSTSEDNRGSGIDVSQRLPQARGNEQVRGKEGARHVGVSLSSSSLPLSYDYDDRTETETETEPERVAKERRRRRRRRGETGQMRRRQERKLSELRSEKGRSKARTDEGKHDTWPAMLDLAAFFATYVLT